MQAACTLRENKKILHPPYLVQLINQFAKLYNEEFPQSSPKDFNRLTKKLDDPKEAYILTVNTFAEALNALADTIAPVCTEYANPPPPTLFSIRSVLADAIIAHQGDEELWQPNQENAFKQFVGVFRNKQDDF